MKKCSICEDLKDLSEFGRDKRSEDGLRSNCKACKRAESKAYRDKNTEYFKQWRDDNKGHVKKYNAKYHSEHRDEANAARMARANLNPGHEASRKKTWYDTNRERILANKKKRYRKNRKKIIQRECEYREKNPVARLRHSLRNRFKRAISGEYKNGSAVENLGCSIEFFKIYLENKFSKGMSWKNYGKWHIDHIRPLASFDLTDRDQVKEACHYTNLQPLWAEDNLRKGDMYPPQRIKEIRK